MRTFLELSISAPFHFSFTASSQHLSMFWGRNDDAGFVIESSSGHNLTGKRVATWRNPACNSLNVAVCGLLLVWNSGKHTINYRAPLAE